MTGIDIVPGTFPARNRASCSPTDDFCRGRRGVAYCVAPVTGLNQLGVNATGRVLKLRLVSQHNEIVVHDEIVKVRDVEGDQRHPVSKAAGRDPCVVLGSRPPPELRRASEFAPHPSYLRVIRDHGTSCCPGVDELSPT